MNIWNITSLKEYFEEKFRASEKAILTALSASDKRLDGMNEFRASLKDQASNFVMKAEYTANINSLNNQIQILNSRMDKRDGEKTGGTELWGYLIGIGGMILAILTFIFRR